MNGPAGGPAALIHANFSVLRARIAAKATEPVIMIAKNTPTSITSQIVGSYFCCFNVVMVCVVSAKSS